MCADDRDEGHVLSYPMGSTGVALVSLYLLHNTIICLLDFFYPLLAIIIGIRGGYCSFKVKLLTIILIIAQPLLMRTGQYNFLFISWQLPKRPIKFLRLLFLLLVIVLMD